MDSNSTRKACCLSQMFCVDSTYISECASASTAAPYFVALHLLQLLSCRRMQYTVCDLQIQFCRFLASSLKVLCISCKFLASSLEVLCKFLASFLLWKFLARSLQGFSIVPGVWRFGRTPEFNIRSDAKNHWKTFNMRPGKFQNLQKSWKMRTGALQAASQARGCFRNAKSVFAGCFFCAFWRPLVDFVRHFGAHWILKGVPKSRFFNINQHKMMKSEVPEGVSKKHDFW